MNKKSERIKRFQVDMDKIRNRASRMEGGGKFWSPKEGVNRIRILPPWNEEGVFYVERRLHYGFKVGGENRAFNCLKESGEKCPACQVIGRYKDEQDKDIKKIVQRLKPKSKWFMNIIDVKAETPEVKIYGAPYKVMKAILGFFSDDDWGNPVDPEEGRDFVIEREGSGIGTQYETRAAAKVSPIKSDNWESQLFDLNKDVDREPVTASEMLGYLEESFPELDLDGIGPQKEKAKKKPVVEEEEEEEEEEEAPAKPAAKKVAKKPTKKIDDDDDDLGDEDDD